MRSRVAVVWLVAGLSAGCGSRTPVVVAAPLKTPAPLPEVDVAPLPRVATPLAVPIAVVPVAVVVAPLPREKQAERVEKPAAPAKPDPEIEAVKTQLAAAMTELRREQQLLRIGSGSDDMVDVALLRVQFATTALAALNNDSKAELASRQIEIEVLTRRWERAKAIYEKLAEFTEPLEARHRELTEGKIRLARFNGDKATLVKEHTVLVGLAEQRLERAKLLYERKVMPEAEVHKCEQIVTLERARLDLVKELRMTPRHVD